MSLTADHIKKLSEPFDEKTIGIKVQSYSKDETKAMLVAYVQHTDAYVRVEQVDPSWSTQVLEVKYHAPDYCTVRMRLTILGVSRDNVGDGSEEKGATSDAFKRCAMLFGVGRYLYDSETVWVPFNKQTDKYKQFTYDDYKKAVRNGQSPLPVGSSPGAAKPASPIRPLGGDRPLIANQVAEAVKFLELSTYELSNWIMQEFGKVQKDLTTDEMKRLLAELQYEIKSREK